MLKRSLAHEARDKKKAIPYLAALRRHCKRAQASNSSSLQEPAEGPLRILLEGIKKNDAHACTS